MNKKLLAVSILLSLSLLLSAQGFQPEFNLRGIAKIEYNEIDVYRFQKGLSITAYPHNKLGTYQIHTIKEIDYDENLVKLTAKLNNIELYPPIYISLESYNNGTFYGYFKSELLRKCKELMGDKDREQSEGLIPEIIIKLPKMALPKSVRRFMGDKAGRLNLNGSQRLTFAGRMSKRSGAQGEGDENTDFTPEMRQDLNLRLRGTIGEKIHVNVNHQSTSDEDVMPTPSEININYEGNEDEIVKAVDGGNISLSLSGSKFISYSASSEGLFGIKTQFEAGNLRVTTIMGKDEAQKTTQKWEGNTRPDSLEMKSSWFVNKTHYYIEQPSALFSLYGDEGVEGVDYPMGWKDNAIKLDEMNKWILSPNGSAMLPDMTKEFTVYLDDGSAINNNTLTVDGENYINPGETYYFDILSQGTDYIVDDTAGILTILLAVNKIYSIGVTYTRNDGTVVGDDSSSPIQAKMLRIKNQDKDFEDYWDLQVRNFYNLGMQNIENEGFEMRVYSKPAASPIPNPTAPAEVLTPNFRDITLNEYLRLDSNNDGKINGEDTAINLNAGYIYFPFIKPFHALKDSIIYYEEPVTESIINYIFVKGKIGREFVDLQMGILPGSIVIRIGPSKRKLIENVDFIADYDFGRVTFLTSEAKNPDIEIIIDYQFKPLFAMDNKTILGLRADMEFNENIKLGGTFVYQSEKVREDRPKIGNENRSIILADIDGEIDYELPFMTKFIDWLPLIKTDARSSVTLSGEVAMSLPRIYGSDKQHDKKEAYLDDMESTMDLYPLGITRGSWTFASRPIKEPSGNLIDYGKAHINYYNPNDVYARDVYDPNSLTEKEEKEKVSVLACKIKPNDIGMPGMNMKYWAGVMKYIGNEIDFSEKKYIEILAKVDTLNYNQESRPVIMHIDLGKMSEDFYRPGQNPDPDKEDGAGFETPVDGFLDGGEDIGLDRIKSGLPGDDPDDDFDNEEVAVNGAEEYPYINGTEGNSKLDSEDLNDNYDLDKDNCYFEYTINLNDGDEFVESEFNGWRLFRIPLHNPENYKIITDNASEVPNIKKIFFSRIWFEVEDSTRVRIVNLDIVGNKWVEGFIKNQDGTVATNDTEIMQVGIADNQSGQHYTPAPHTVIEEHGEATLEQALTIDYKDLEAKKHGLVTQEFTDPHNLLAYNKIRYWVYAEKPIEGYSPLEQDSLIIRLGADSVNYYEIKQPLDLQEFTAVMNEDGWNEIEIEFSEFTQLKNLDSRDDVSYYLGNIKLSKIGNPSLSDIREMSLGVEASNQFSGRIYFNDIRVADPYEDMGFATSANFTTSFADLATFHVGLDFRSENFQSSARRTTNVSYVKQTDLDITNRINLNKFMPAEWGFNIPLNLSRTQSVGIPRFKSGSDILRDDLLAEDKERETNKNLSYRADVSMTQTKTPKSKILAYTIKNTTISGNIQKTLITNATRADTTIAYTLKHIYNFTIPKEKIDIGLFSNYKFHFFPHSMYNSLTLRDSDPLAWRWDTYTDSIPHWAPNTASFKTRTFETSSKIDYNIFSDISTSYNLETKRDLMLKNYWKGYNIGEEKERTQDITVSFDPRYIDNIFTFNADASVTYDDDHVKSGTQDTLYYRGGVNRRIGGNFTLKNQDLLHDLANWLDKKLSGTTEVKEPEIEPEQQSIEETREEERERFEQREIRSPFGEEEPKNEYEEPENEQSGDSKGEGSLEDGSPKDPGKGDEDEQKEPDEEPEPPTIPESKSHPLASIVSYISGLSNISVSYDNIYRTTYDDRFERPNFLYQLGLPHILNEEEGVDKEIILKTVTDKYSTSASFPIIRNLTTNFGYSREIIRTFSNNESEKKSTIFPNVSVTLTEFEKLIRATKILTSSRLTSSYIYSKVQNGDINFIKADSEQKRFNLTPLISWHGNWVHDITSSFSLNYSDQENITHRTTYDVIRHTVTKSMNGNLSWSFSNPKGIRILFFKRTNMKNEFTTDVDFGMEMTKTTTEGEDGKEVKEIHKETYNVTPGASYKFNKSITAGLTSEYDWSKDRKRKTDSSTFRVSIWIEILF